MYVICSIHQIWSHLKKNKFSAMFILLNLEVIRKHLRYAKNIANVGKWINATATWPANYTFSHSGLQQLTVNTLLYVKKYEDPDPRTCYEVGTGTDTLAGGQAGKACNPNWSSTTVISQKIHLPQLVVPQAQRIIFNSKSIA